MCYDVRVRSAFQRVGFYLTRSRNTRKIFLKVKKTYSQTVFFQTDTRL